ncbi:MAG: glycosyltransferase, partial [Bacteroidia bacterium]
MNPIVIIPTYNEKENILNMLDKVMSLDTAFDVLVVD